jgi:hypothetical protein
MLSLNGAAAWALPIGIGAPSRGRSSFFADRAVSDDGDWWGADDGLLSPFSIWARILSALRIVV